MAETKLDPLEEKKGGAKVTPEGGDKYKAGAAEDDDDGSGSEDSEFSDSDEEEGESDTGLTQNQNRLLYMVRLCCCAESTSVLGGRGEGKGEREGVREKESHPASKQNADFPPLLHRLTPTPIPQISLYTHKAQNVDEQEEWIRQQALLVLLYEAIVAQVLDYDYAPQSCLVEHCRKYFNITQEGKSDVDFLREEELINGLKLASKEYQPVTCFQISEKGSDVLKKVSKGDREAVNELVYAPRTRDLLKIEWSDDVGLILGLLGGRERELERAGWQEQEPLHFIPSLTGNHPIRTKSTGCAQPPLPRNRRSPNVRTFPTFPAPTARSACGTAAARPSVTRTERTSATRATPTFATSWMRSSR